MQIEVNSQPDINSRKTKENIMQKFLTLLIMIAMLYTIIQLNLQRKAPPAENVPVAQTQVQQEEKTVEQPLSGNFLEKTLSSVLINVLKTEQGLPPVWFGRLSSRQSRYQGRPL